MSEKNKTNVQRGGGPVPPHDATLHRVRRPQRHLDLVDAGARRHVEPPLVHQERGVVHHEGDHGLRVRLREDTRHVETEDAVLVGDRLRVRGGRRGRNLCSHRAGSRRAKPSRVACTTQRFISCGVGPVTRPVTTYPEAASGAAGAGSSRGVTSSVGDATPLFPRSVVSSARSSAEVTASGRAGSPRPGSSRPSPTSHGIAHARTRTTTTAARRRRVIECRPRRTRRPRPPCVRCALRARCCTCRRS